jgi:hypothetical protein
MADPERLDASALHPCKDCDGARSLTRYAWRAPGYWAECRHCGTSAVGDSAAAALAAWNTEHPARALAPEDELGAPEAVQEPASTIDALCTHGTHVAHKLPSGSYVCVQCGLGFVEQHTIVLQAGAGAAL